VTADFKNYQGGSKHLIKIAYFDYNVFC